MSTVKSPEAKKQLSLERDRRNRYGENSKSSRKSIQRGKQRQHMDERRAVGEVLGRLKGNIQEDDATAAELLAKAKIAASAAGVDSRNGRIHLSEWYWRRRRPRRNQSSPLPSSTFLRAIPRR
jgi:hypothetical protein